MIRQTTYTASNKFQIETYQDCEAWAKDIVPKYHLLRANEFNRGDASNWLAAEVGFFARRMSHEGKIHRIHESCVERLKNVRLQERNQYAVVLLLLKTVDPIGFSRSVRHRVACRAGMVT